MHDSSTSFRRHHHLCVSVAKHVFLKANGTLAIADQPVRLDDARELGLAPLVLFAVSTFGAPLYWAKLAPVNDIPSLSGVLLEAWESAAGLRGRPDAVIVTEPVAAAAPALRPSLQSAGIELLVGTDTRTHAAVLRTMQREILHMLSWAEREDPSRMDLARFAAEVARDHSTNLDWMDLQAFGERRKCKELWVKLPLREVSQIALGAASMELGNWATSWELTLPPTRPLALRDRHGLTHIMERQCEREPDEGAEEERMEQIGRGRDIARTVKLLLDCWPNELTEVAHAIGTTARQLQWFLAGHEVEAEFPYQRLVETFSLGSNEYGEVITKGPHVFLAQGTVRATKELFEEITGGGDQEYSFEVVPLFGKPDPSFRYILFARCFEPESPFVLVVPRGSRLTQSLSEYLINLEPEPRSVSDAFYRDVVATCGRASRDSTRNRQELMALTQRHMMLLRDEFARDHPSLW